MSPTFRIDDISVNTPKEKLTQMMGMIETAIPDSTFILALSPITFDMSEHSGLTSERLFPKILNAYSDFRLFYQGSKIGVPEYWSEITQKENVQKASHGLVHVDHRLLRKSAQEMSILVSSAIATAEIFVPPFNKWNEQTEQICEENQIKLIKFEEGWKHLSYQPLGADENANYYFHTHDFSVEYLKSWLKND